MIKYSACERFLAHSQHLPPEVLIAGEVLLHEIAEFVDSEAVVGVFEAVEAGCHDVCISVYELGFAFLCLEKWG